ncbi:MAG: TIGR02206 family membrane protein [Vicinamibacteria bacterium]
MIPRRFVIFGPDHRAVLALTPVAAFVLVALARRHRDDRTGTAVRVTLAALMLAGVLGYVGAELRLGQVALVEFLPLHLCDAAIFVGVFALVTRKALACELLYFWALAGSTLAMVTPEVIWAFPDWRFVVFFLMHGLTVIAAAVLTFGFGCRPRPGAAWRAFGLTLGYAVLVAGLNRLLDANFLYLRAKPVTPTLLDRFGPWPWYLVVSAAIGLALFHVLALPFRETRRPGAPPRSASGSAVP